MPLWSPAQERLLSATLRTFIPADLPVVATLGNHKFWGRSFEDTLAKLKEQTLAGPNIFYLDLIGAVKLGEVNFVGGTLFFDGSMRIRDNQRVDEWDGWQDWHIVDIESRYMEINAYYVDMIRSKMKSGMPTILMAGRVLRKSPAKAFANIVQSKETKHMAKRIAEPQTVWLWRNQEFQAVSGRNEKVLEMVMHYLDLRDKRGDIKLPELLFEGRNTERVYAQQIEKIQQEKRFHPLRKIRMDSRE